MYKYSVVSTKTLADNATQTLLMIKSATAVPVKINAFWCGFNGSAAGQAIRVQLARFSTDGTGAASPPTPEDKYTPDRAAQATILHNHSAEPTIAGGPLFDMPVAPNGGGIYIQYPLDEEWVVLEGGNRIAIRVINSTGVTPLAGYGFEFSEG